MHILNDFKESYLKVHSAGPAYNVYVVQIGLSLLFGLVFMIEREKEKTEEENSLSAFAIQHERNTKRNGKRGPHHLLWVNVVLVRIDSVRR